MLSELRQALAPFPGRMDTMWRYVVSSALVITISMALQVPFLAISLIMVFFVVQENTVLSRLFGKVMVIGTTLGVGAAIVLLRFTIDYPLWRIVGACVIAFAGMYFLRISRLGAMGFMLALTTVYAQSLVDLTDSSEALLRGLLWFWMACVYPSLLTMGVNALFRPAHPARLLRDEQLRQLGEVHAQLEAAAQGRPLRPMSPDQVEQGVLTLHRHLGFAAMDDAGIEATRGRQLMRVAAIDRLHTAAAQLALSAQALSEADRARCRALQLTCQALIGAIEQGRNFAGAELPAYESSAGSHLQPVLQEIGQAFAHFAEADLDQGVQPGVAPAAAPALAPDAFDNPRYAQFALKSVLSALICYCFYTALAWPGIHTAMLTCLIMALPSLGATSHKGLLRIFGCAIGSVLGLLATVFVVPHLDGIVGLLALSLPVVALSGWVAAGSPRISYLGVQIMFAFALGVYGHFGPGTDLTEFRDRMVGIVVGVAASLAMFVWVWPEREGAQLRGQLARLLRAIAAVGSAAVGASSAGPAGSAQAGHQARLCAWSLLRDNRELQARVALEPGLEQAHGAVNRRLTTALAQGQAVLMALHHLSLQMEQRQQALEPAQRQAIAACVAECHEELEAVAAYLEQWEEEGSEPEPAEAVFAVIGDAPRLAARRQALQNAGLPEPLAGAAHEALDCLLPLLNTCAMGATS
ncbi:MAG: FUSC family protein [Paucibacter sp.]|nr:FUSC family protein [Roseateles sp.]